jgi:hypothetical protein
MVATAAMGAAMTRTPARQQAGFLLERVGLNELRKVSGGEVEDDGSSDGP